MTERLWDDRLKALGVTVQESDHALDHRALRYAFALINGQWGERGDGTVPEWAWDYHADIGGETHVYGRLVEEGQIAPGAGFFLTWINMTEEPKVRLPEAGNGYYASDYIGGTNAGYNWKITTGPYQWGPVGNSDRIVGIGLPYPPLPWEISASPAEMYNALRAPGRSDKVILAAMLSIFAEMDKSVAKATAGATAGGVHVSVVAGWEQCGPEQHEPGNGCLTLPGRILVDIGRRLGG